MFSTRNSAFVVRGSRDFREQKKTLKKEEVKNCRWKYHAKFVRFYRCLSSVPLFPPAASVTNSFSTIFTAAVPFRILPNKMGPSRFVIVVRNAHVVVGETGGARRIAERFVYTYHAVRVAWLCVLRARANGSFRYSPYNNVPNNNNICNVTAVV